MINDENTNEKRKPRTMQQWGEYRRSNPRQFYSPETQKLMMSDRQQLGEKFYERKRTEDDA